MTGFVGISEDGADWLVSHGIILVGIDYLSVAPYHKSIPRRTGLCLLPVIIVEGLDFSAIEPGNYELFCLPLKLVGSDGAPARVILQDLNKS